MTTEDYIQNYSGNKANSQHCDYDTWYQRYHSAVTYTSESVRHWPNIHMCISKNGSKRGPLDLKNPETGQRKSLEMVDFCSVNNSTNSGSKTCNVNNKIDFKYMVTWDVIANLTVYKFNRISQSFAKKSNYLSFYEFWDW